MPFHAKRNSRVPARDDSAGIDPEIGNLKAVAEAIFGRWLDRRASLLRYQIDVESTGLGSEENTAPL